MREDYADRNAALRADFVAGVRMCDMCAKYQLSRQRIFQIASGLKRPPGGHWYRKPPMKIELSPVAVEKYRRKETTMIALAELYGVARETMRKRLRGVKRRQRKQEIYELFKGGMTLAELACQFGITVGAVGQYIHRARSKDPNPYFRPRRHQKRSEAV